MSKIVIIGAGFGGLHTALHLKKMMPRKIPAEITILGEENFFLFTPMLSEIVSGEVESRHILTSVRSFLTDKRFRFHQAMAKEVDFGKKMVVAYCAKHHCLHIPYDYLVIAIGSKARLPEQVSAKERWIFPLKTLSDGLVLHNQILDMFEHAEMLERSDSRRNQMLTFVIAGGGFAGIETAASIHDMIFSTLLLEYPGVSEDEIRVIITHGGDRILPELGKDLALYTTKFLKRGKIEIRLNSLATVAREGVVMIGEEEIPTATLVWTAGAATNELADLLDVSKDQKGRIVADEYCRVPGRDGVFVLGDCAYQEDKKMRRPHPPTAQVAIRQARVVAKNIVARVNGKQLSPFAFETVGMFVPLGHHSAVAIVKGLKIRGFLAWSLSRSLFLLRLPTWSNRIRVAVDWFLDLFFRKDTVKMTLR